MKFMINSIITDLETTTKGNPWYGDALVPTLQQIPKEIVYTRIDGANSIIEITKHLLNWYQFSLERVKGSSNYTLHTAEENNWTIITAADILWEDCIKELDKLYNSLISQLSKKEDAFLNEIVPERTYTYSFLLYGLIQHNIYHLGQIQLLKKILTNKPQS
ncbi:MAG TPA: hypothetical protein DIW54_14040 [Chitinophagaceae bacterium]|nr:hypothetical protein [Chitinophagaceae bacterium]